MAGMHASFGAVMAGDEMLGSAAASGSGRRMAWNVHGVCPAAEQEGGVRERHIIL